MIKILLKNKIEINVQDKEYDNILQTISYEDHGKIMKILLKSKIEINV